MEKIVCPFMSGSPIVIQAEVPKLEGLNVRSEPKIVTHMVECVKGQCAVWIHIEKRCSFYDTYMNRTQRRQVAEEYITKSVGAHPDNAYSGNRKE